MNEFVIKHHGVKGQKWGIRRYQNYDGTRIKNTIRKDELISETNYNKINEMYKSMPYEDRKLIDPSNRKIPKNYFKSLKQYNDVTVYNKVTKNGFLVAEKIKDDENIEGTKGVEIGIGVINKGQGFGTKLTNDLVDWFNFQDEYDVLWWPVDIKNKASIRVAENNGFFKDPLGDNWVLPKKSAYENLGFKEIDIIKHIDDELYHYGTKGMKWGVTNEEDTNPGQLNKSSLEDYKSKTSKYKEMRDKYNYKRSNYKSEMNRYLDDMNGITDRKALMRQIAKYNEVAGYYNAIDGKLKKLDGVIKNREKIYDERISKLLKKQTKTSKAKTKKVKAEQQTIKPTGKFYKPEKKKTKSNNVSDLVTKLQNDRK